MPCDGRALINTNKRAGAFPPTVRKGNKMKRAEVKKIHEALKNGLYIMQETYFDFSEGFIAKAFYLIDQGRNIKEAVKPEIFEALKNNNIITAYVTEALCVVYGLRY